MKEHPIIFSGPMVKALLDGRKTQTRRLATSPLRRVEPGDKLWVRESFAAEELSRPAVYRPATKREQAAYGRTRMVECDALDGADGLRYLADDQWVRIVNTPQAGEAWSAAFHYGGERPKGPRGKNIPSIHMPRWASRLTLAVTDVRFEWLRAITFEDAMAEGVERRDGKWVDYFDGLERGKALTARESYASLWMKLHGRESWVSNPLVVALTFTVERAHA